jgi:arylsulfatase A-like enzyme
MVEGGLSFSSPVILLQLNAMKILLRLLTFMGICLSIGVAQTQSAPNRPNIILIMGDDMGFSDIGRYGGEIQTPNLDRLGEKGLSFSQFYNNARCCPTRATLLTGLYPHQAGVGHMMGDYGIPSYQGNLNKQSVTIAEALKPAGYSTYISGKWHVARHISPEGPKHTWPRQRGFDRFYGTITGAGSFYDPATLCRDNNYITPENDPDYQPETYYYTDAITDNAIRFLQDHEESQDATPFFLYVSYTAAHWPMHALPEDIQKYEGLYDAGYAPARQKRLERLISSGLLSPEAIPAPMVGDWAAQENKTWEAACMEVYAAMVDRMDQGIGKLTEQLKESGEFENTIILYLQDNGGCAEGAGRSSNLEQIANVQYEPLGRDGFQKQIWPPMQTRDGRAVKTGPEVLPGPADTFIGYGRNWANVSNTPFKEYKHWVHEGGISTPLIAHWPEGIKSQGSWNNTPTHLIDIMATLVEVAEANYPQEYEGNKIQPMQGISLAPAFNGNCIVRSNPIFWEHEGNRAVRKGRWKLVAKGVEGEWELYDMDTDRTESTDLAQQRPEMVASLTKEYDAWAKMAGVVPFGSWKK